MRAHDTAPLCSYTTSTISQADADALGLNLRLEGVAASDMTFEWRSQEGIVENIGKVVK